MVCTVIPLCSKYMMPRPRPLPGGGGYRRMYVKYRHSMGVALAGHTLSFSTTSSPDCYHVGLEYGSLGAVCAIWE